MLGLMDVRHKILDLRPCGCLKSGVLSTVLGGLPREAQRHRALRCKSSPHPHDAMLAVGFTLQSLAETIVEIPILVYKKSMESNDILKLLESQLRYALEFVEIDNQGRAIERRFLINRIGSIKIEIYPNEHPPPHFHVKSPDINATFEIVNCRILNGDLDTPTMKKIEYFHSRNKETLIEVWNKLRPTDCLVGKIVVQ